MQVSWKLVTFDATRCQLSSVASLSHWASTLLVCSTFAVIQRQTILFNEVISKDINIYRHCTLLTYLLTYVLLPCEICWHLFDSAYIAAGISAPPYTYIRFVQWLLKREYVSFVSVISYLTQLYHHLANLRACSNVRSKPTHTVFISWHLELSSRSMY